MVRALTIIALLASTAACGTEPASSEDLNPVTIGGDGGAVDLEDVDPTDPSDADDLELDLDLDLGVTDAGAADTPADAAPADAAPADAAPADVDRDAPHLDIEPLDTEPGDVPPADSGEDVPPIEDTDIDGSDAESDVPIGSDTTEDVETPDVEPPDDCEIRTPADDLDRDLVADRCDVCPEQADPEQGDANGDGVGDACQDTDGDGVLDGPVPGAVVRLWRGYTGGLAAPVAALGTPDEVFHVDTIDWDLRSEVFGEPRGATNFAAEIEFGLRLPVAGTWSFELWADDGARMWVDGVEVINHDGLHSFYPRSTTATFGAGVRDVLIRYAQAGGDAGLQLFYWGPGYGRSIVPAGAMRHADLCPEDVDPTQLDSDGDGRGDACDDSTGYPSFPCEVAPSDLFSATPDDLRVLACVTSRWPAGYCVRLLVTNLLDRVNRWTLSADVAGRITSHWSSERRGDVGTVEFSGQLWNAELVPGEATEIGFCAAL